MNMKIEGNPFDKTSYDRLKKCTKDQNEREVALAVASGIKLGLDMAIVHHCGELEAEVIRIGKRKKISKKTRRKMEKKIIQNTKEVSRKEFKEVYEECW